MYDYHMHSRVSFDGHDTGLAMARAAARYTWGGLWKEVAP